MTEETQTKTENKEIKTIKNNSEVLFLYDAKMCNPNGDPDDENKPRMDYNRNINLVSDVRLKRYIRDYLMNHKDTEIFVCKVGGETVDVTNRLKKLIKKYTEEIKNDKELKDLLSNKDEPTEKNLSKHLPWLLSKLTDVRLFGATMPLKDRDVGKGKSISFTGPIQFNWGYSLNKVSGSMESSGITATFAGATKKQGTEEGSAEEQGTEEGSAEEHGTMGKDYRVAYSLIGFHGIISAKRAEHTDLGDKDIDLFDDVMINAIPMEATTRSKTGQEPLLYIRVEYNSRDFFCGDFRRYVKIKDKKGNDILWEDSAKLRSIMDYSLDLSELKKKLESNKSRIKDIYLWKHQDLSISGFDDLKEVYLLRYNDIFGNDSVQLIHFLKNYLKIEWAENAEIKKDDNGDITVTKEKNSLTFKKISMSDESRWEIVKYNENNKEKTGEIKFIELPKSKEEK